MTITNLNNLIAPVDQTFQSRLLTEFAHRSDEFMAWAQESILAQIVQSGHDELIVVPAVGLDAEDLIVLFVQDHTSLIPDATSIDEVMTWVHDTLNELEQAVGQGGGYALNLVEYLVVNAPLDVPSTEAARFWEIVDMFVTNANSTVTPTDIYPAVFRRDTDDELRLTFMRLYEMAEPPTHTGTDEDLARLDGFRTYHRDVTWLLKYGPS